jgi:hypothetical protein
MIGGQHPINTHILVNRQLCYPFHRIANGDVNWGFQCYCNIGSIMIARILKPRGELDPFTGAGEGLI